MPSLNLPVTIDWFGMFGKIAYWFGYSLLAAGVAGGVGAAYYWTSFKNPVTVFPLYGSGKDGIFSVGKAKTNRIKWIKNKTAWKKLYPLFNRKELEPFDSEYIYPGNKMYAFELNDEWIPGRINIKQDENTIRGELNPVPHYARNWQSLQYKKNAEEFSRHSFWDDNKYFITTAVTVGFCCVLCGITIYFAYQFATGGTNQIGALTQAIKNFNVIQ